MTSAVDSPSRLTTLIKRLKTEYAQKGMKFIAVSAFNVLFGQTLLLLGQEAFGWEPVVANFVAVAISAFPAYLLSRYWVWQKSGKNHFWKEVVPFWSLALIGLAFSTFLIWIIENNFSKETIVIQITNLVAFGIVWVAKFFVLDKVLFKHEELTDDPLDVFVDQALHHRHYPGAEFETDTTSSSSADATASMDSTRSSTDTAG